MIDKRFLIIGNSGAGKTWTGKAIAQKLNIPVFFMDKIWWEPGNYHAKRSLEDIEKDIEKIVAQKNWILEGVFGQIIQQAIPFATNLIWLDLEWQDCKNNLIQRGPQLESCLSKEEEQLALIKLIEWASTHYSRQDENSEYFFQKIFSQFSSTKVQLHHRSQISDYITSLQA